MGIKRNNKIRGDKSMDNQFKNEYTRLIKDPKIRITVYYDGDDEEIEMKIVKYLHKFEI